MSNQPISKEPQPSSLRLQQRLADLIAENHELQEFLQGIADSCEQCCLERCRNAHARPSPL